MKRKVVMKNIFCTFVAIYDLKFKITLDFVNFLKIGT